MKDPHLALRNFILTIFRVKLQSKSGLIFYRQAAS